MKKDGLLPYRVGGLLYTPALDRRMAEMIRTRAYPALTSVAFCLEDSIQDAALPQAEQDLAATLADLVEIPAGELPLLFVRVRTPRHLERVHRLLGDREAVLTGYILPKFDLSNGEEYARLIKALC